MSSVSSKIEKGWLPLKTFKRPLQAWLYSSAFVYGFGETSHFSLLAIHRKFVVEMLLL
jgi:hypothetical protein